VNTCLDGDNNVLHLRFGVLLFDNSECGVSVANTITITPSWQRRSVAAMVEAVLGLRCAVKIDDDLQTALSGPVDSCVEVFSGTLRVWTPWRDVAEDAQVSESSHADDAQKTNLQ
jgi:hypothetical protein